MRKHSVSYRIRRIISAGMAVAMLAGSVQIVGYSDTSFYAEEVSATGMSAGNGAQEQGAAAQQDLQGQTGGASSGQGDTAVPSDSHGDKSSHKSDSSNSGSGAADTSNSGSGMAGSSNSGSGVAGSSNSGSDAADSAISASSSSAETSASASSASASSGSSAEADIQSLYDFTYSVEPADTAEVTFSFPDKGSNNCIVSVKADEGYAISETAVNDDDIELTDTQTAEGMSEDGSFASDNVISGSYTVENVQSDTNVRVTTVRIFDAQEEKKLETKADEQYRVTLTGTRKAFGRAVSAKASIIPEQEAQQLADGDDTIPDNSEVVAALDITLTDSDGNEVEPDGIINVGIDRILENNTADADGQKLELYHMKDDNTTESLEMSTDNDKSKGITKDGIGFATDSFSKFFIMRLLTLSPVTITGSITLGTDSWTKADLNNDSTNQNAMQFVLKQDDNKIFTTTASSIVWKKNTSNTSVWEYTITGNMSIDSTKELTMEAAAVSPAKFKYVLSSDNMSTSFKGSLSGSNGTYSFGANPTLKAQTNKLSVKQNAVTGKAFSYKVSLKSPYDKISLSNATVAAGSEAATWDIPAGVGYTVTPVDVDDYISAPASASGTVNSSNTSEADFKRIKADSPTFTVQWEDNNNANKNRPSKDKVTMKLQYKTADGEYKDWSTGFSAAEPTPVVDTAASVSNWTYKYTKIPMVTDAGVEVVSFRLAETLDSSSSYVKSYAADGITIINQETFDFIGYVDWNDAAALSANSKKPRPSVADNLNIKVWAHTAGTGSQYATPADITNNISFKWDETSLNTDKYKYTINLPIYDVDDNPITYYCVPANVENAAEYTSNGGTGKYEAPVCDNGQGAYGNVTNKCYDNGTISYVFTDNVTISGTKKWIDGNADSSSRPAATLYLYRYTAIGSNSYGNGAAAQYAGAAKTDPFITQKVSASGGSFTFPDSTALEAGKTLPKYDADGNRYVYYVEERFDSDDKGYSSNCVNPEATGLGSYDGKIMLEGGTIENSICELRDINIDKKWSAVADQSVVDKTNLYIGLIRKSAKAGSTYEIVTSAADNTKPYVLKYSGFTKDDLYKRNTFKDVPSTDAEGYAYTYSAFECTGNADGSYNTGNIAFAVGTESDTISNKVVLGDAGSGAKLSDREIKIGSIQYAVTEATVAKDSNDEYTAELDNKPSGKLNYVVEKVWGNDADHSTDTNYRPTVTYTIWQRDYNGNSIAIESGKNLTNTNYITSEGNKWSCVYSSGSKTIEAYHLDRYDADGHEYTYYVTETSSHPGYYQSPTTYSYDEATDTYTGTLYNTWGTGGTYTYIPVTKTWQDGGKVSLRQPVKIVLYKKNTISGLITNADADNLPSVTLNAGNGWQGSIGYDATKYTLASGEEFVIREASVGTGTNEYTVDYDSDGDSNILTGTYTVPGTALTEDETYSVTVAESGDKWNITNKKTGTVGFAVHKLWHDNGLTSRNKLQLILKRNDENYAVYEQTAADSYGDKNNFKASTSGNGYDNATASVGTNDSNNEIVISFGSSLPKYDDKGAPYTYTVSERLYNSEGSGSWVVPSAVKYDAVASDAIYNKTYKPYTGAAEFTKTYVSEMVNTKASGPVSPKFYKKWIDDDNSGNTRCDISLTLWRKIDKGTNDKDIVEKVPGYVQRVWTKNITDDEKKFSDWLVTFALIPSSVDADMVAQDSNLSSYLGHDIHYYVTENMDAANDYVTSYYTGGSEADKNYLADTYKTDSGNSISVTDSSIYPAPENGVIVNRLYDKMTLSGVKIWHNMPSGTHQAVIDDNSILFTLQYQLSISDTAKDYKYNEAKGSLIETDYGSKTVTANLTKTGSSYGYKFTADGSYDGTALELPKYNDAGKKYIYSVKETFNNSDAAQNTELELLYPNPEISLTKDFKLINTYTAAGNKDKKISVYKFWDMTGWDTTNDGEVVYPSVKFTLYRGDPGTALTADGKLPAAGTYETVGSITKTGAEIKTALNSTPVSNLIGSWTQPEYAANGKEYVYFVEEQAISGYTSYSAKGATKPDANDTNKHMIVTIENNSSDAKQEFEASFLNSYQAIDVSSITIAGKKNWYNSDGKTAYDRNSAWLPKLSQLNLKLQRSATGVAGSYTDITCKIKCDDTNNTFTVCESGSDNLLKLHRYNSEGKPYYYRIVEPAPSSWTDYASHYIWKNFNGNKEFDYTLGTSSADKSSVLNFTLNNKFGTDYSITKSWNDNMNNDGFRPTSVVFKLQYTVAESGGKADWSEGNVQDCTEAFIGSSAYNGTSNFNGSTLDLSDKVVLKVTPGDGNTNKTYSWNTAKLTSLPQYDTNGNTIHYRAIEVLTDKYPVTDNKAASYYYNAADWTYTDAATRLVNSIDATQAKVTKIWDDNNDEYKVCPALLDVYLQRTTKSDYTKDGNDVITTAEADMSWEYVKTTTAPNGVKRTLSAADSWTETVTYLPKVSPDGKTYTYRFTETPPVGTVQLGSYKRKSQTDKAVGTSFESAITNTISEIAEPDTRSLTVEKKWDNADYTSQPSSTTIELLYSKYTAKGSGYSWSNYSPIKTVVLNNANSWKYTWTKLPEKDAYDNRIIYKAVELDNSSKEVAEGKIWKGAALADASVKDYKVSYQYDTAEDFTTPVSTAAADKTYERITNRLSIADISGSKVWTDDNGTDNTRRPEVKLTIYSDITGSKTALNPQPEITWTKSGSTWTYSIDNLPKYRNDGGLITYYVEEADIKGYTPVGGDTNGTCTHTVICTDTDNLPKIYSTGI